MMNILHTHFHLKNSFQSFLLVVLTVLMPAKMLAQEPYAVLTDENTVLRFYYDDQKDVRGGMSVGPFSSSDEVSWYENRESITSVVFDASFADCTTLTSTAYWFFFFTNLTSITGISNLKTDNVTNMEGMFWRCSILTSLDLSSFNTSKVTHIGWMFYECWSLTSLNVSSFNTENVTDMCSMFGFCRKLTNLDLSSFNTSNVTRMESMFVGCESLTALDVTGFITEKVTNMTQMFMGCVGLKNLDLSNFNTANVTDMYMMFYSNPSLKTIYVGNYWSTASVTNSDYMFEECPALIGGAGTKYSEDHVDHSYAHIDGGTTNPGYFTESGAEPFVYPTEPYAVLSNENTVLTFYYDDQKDVRGGMSVGPFNNEAERGWQGNSSSVQTVVFDDSFADCTTITSTAYWFSLCKNLTSITGISNLKTDNVTNMNSMFYECRNLTSLDVSGFNTANVTNMSQMFCNCLSLTSLDLSGFNTANVTDMGGLFMSCSGLTSLDVSGFNTDNVERMNAMFFDCSGLTTLDVSMFNTANVTKMSAMFNQCYKLVTLNVGNFKTDKVTDMGSMFRYCNALTDLDVSGFNTANVTSMKEMFSGCESLSNLDVSGFNTVNVTDMSGMFDDCESLTSLDVSGFNTENVTDMSSMFGGCSSLTSLDVSGFNTANVTKMGYMFIACSGLTSLDLSNFNTEKVTSMYGMFYKMHLTSLDLSSFNTSNVTTMVEMFRECGALTNINLSSFNTSNVTTMEQMFWGCNSLTSLDISSFNTANVTDMVLMFYACNALKTIYVGNGWSTDNVTESGSMFKECFALVGGAGTTYTDEHSDHTYAHIDGGTSNPGYLTDINSPQPYAALSDGNTVLTFYCDDQRAARNGMSVGPFSSTLDVPWNENVESITSVVFDASFADCTTITSTARWFSGCQNLSSITGMEKLNTANVTDMFGMFHRCSSLTSLDLSSFNTENVTVMQDMFSSCTALTSLDLSSFNTENVTDMQEMFLHCSALTALDLSSFNTANVTKMGAMFEQCEALTSLNVSSFNTINVTDMYEMFRDTALPSLDLSNFNTTNVTDMGQMFDGCSALTSIDVSSFNTANVSDIHRMFYDCSHLETIYVGNDWSTASVTSGDGMFTNCTALVGGKGTTYDENHTDYTYAHIDGGKTNPGYFTDKNAVAVDATFDSMGVLTVGGSTTMADALEAVGGGAEVAKTITAIVWNSTETLTNSDLQGLDNPNMLIFVNEASVAPDHSNVVIDGQAKEIILKDVTEGNNNWYCPQPFTAEKISYTRTFSQQTKIGVSRGWETIALPFDVQTISHATKGVISPFGNYSGNYNFWLRRLTQNGLQSVQEINANTPYIISMPNSSEYPVEYNLAGEVTFSAENAFVPETENYFVESENYAMAPIFMYIEAKEELYVLNVGEERNNHPEGSIFERNYRAVRPFEAATQHMNPSRFAPQFISVADLGGGDDTTELQELKNGRMEELKYYDLQGRRVLKPSKGVYIQNGNKVIIK